MNTPFKKRSNPLAQTGKSVEPQSQPIQQEQVVQPQPIQQEIPVQPQQVVQQPIQQPQPVYYQPQQTRIVKDNNREKYTATMEKELRIRVKVASARKGIQFSQFIEEAVMEKLRREGL